MITERKKHLTLGRGSFTVDSQTLEQGPGTINADSSLGFGAWRTIIFQLSGCDRLFQDPSEKDVYTSKGFPMGPCYGPL